MWVSCAVDGATPMHTSWIYLGVSWCDSLLYSMSFVTFAFLDGHGSFHPANATKESFVTPAVILILDSDSCENPLT